MGLACEARRLFFNTAITVMGLIRNTRAVSRMPLPLMSHVDHLAADLRHPASILVLQEKDPPRALPILTLIALGPIGLFACLDYFHALTVRTLHRDRDHRLPPRANVVYGEYTGKLPICNITVQGSINNLFRLGRHLLPAHHYRTLRTRAFAM